jgi:dTDP-4-amino-4,6-dideoxygalactose transaminase
MLIPINGVDYTKNERLIRSLENMICEYSGSKHCILTNSGTSALFIPLFYMNSIYEGAEVLLPAYGFPAAYRICKSLGLKPITVDLNYKNMGLNLEDARRKINKNTKCIVHVETNGIMGNVNEIKTFAEEYNLFFIEDSAASMIQKCNGVSGGRFGQVGIYSFSETKPLKCGCGGAIITDSDEIYKIFKKISYDPDHSSVYPLSFNLKMSHLLVKELIPQFETINSVIKNYEQTYALYKKYKLQIFEDKSVTNRYQHILYRSEKAKQVSQKLNSFSIGHRYKHYMVDENETVAKRINDEIIDLPLFSNINETQIKSICNLIRTIEDDKC